MAEYIEKLCDIEEVPAPDDLARANAIAGAVTLTVAGDYKRGEILMKQGDSFVKATAAGIAGAEELCVMCDDFVLDDGMTARKMAYFFGKLNGKRIYVSGELLNMYDGTEKEAVIEALRKHKIFVR